MEDTEDTEDSEDSVTRVALRHVLAWLAREAPRVRPSPPVLAITGAQGSGKTTLLRELPRALSDAGGYRVAALSLDDFYLPRAARLALGRKLHPLFVTRGVPGTHDLTLLERVLDELRAGRGASLPRFDKAADDRAPAGGWGRIDPGQLDLIVIEGWCLALPPQADTALAEPVNALERLEDPESVWRRAVNRRLATDYRRLFARFDWVVALMAPSFDAVFEWRREQEQALLATLTATEERGPGLVADAEELTRFLAHFERLTRHGLDCLPTLAKLSIDLDEARQVVRVTPEQPVRRSAPPE